MTRYETWRQVYDAPGPAEDRYRASPQLSDAFFAGNAASIDTLDARSIAPERTFESLIDAAAEYSGDAGELTRRLFYRPPGEQLRLPAGRSEAYAVRHDESIPLWQRFEGPIERRHGRFGYTWPYVSDWRAGADGWTASHGRLGPHLLRAVRDAEGWGLDELDAALDLLDGDQSHEYGDAANPQRPGGDVAGRVRQSYLARPPYRGPIVNP
jgi:hypothetical protein